MHNLINDVAVIERDGLLKLADKLDSIETDLNFIRSLLHSEKSALNDLKQNLAPISGFFSKNNNSNPAEKSKKKSVNFSLTPTTSKDDLISDQINLISESEFDQLPKYLKGRITLIKINGFVHDFNRFLIEKYTLLLRSNPSKLSVDQRQKFFEWKAAEIESLHGRNFLTETDLKAKNGSGHFKFDQVARNILTILRQVGRIKEVRSSGVIRYVIN